MDTGLIDWEALTLFCYIVSRMFGFVMFNPFFSRSGVPATARIGMVLAFTLTAQSAYTGPVHVPVVLLDAMFRFTAEMGVGLALSFVIRFFFYIPEQAGELVDAQMGMAMARNYDPGSQSSSTVTANLLSQMMVVLFFLGNGHVTLIRLMLTSGELIPFGAAALGPRAADRSLALFTECALLAVKMGFPILAAELMGQIGMGILMKVIPQINVFAMNIELKVIMGMVMISLLMAPMGSFLLETESYMLARLQELLTLMTGQGMTG